nr:hypothetical protein GCM10025732_11840 [Glycomyces mayteni]
MITHDHDVAERAQRAVTIRDGELREGNHVAVPTDEPGPGTLVSTAP